MSIRLDATRIVDAYKTAFRRLSALPGFSQRDILRAEAGSILKTWAGRTKVRTQERIERATRTRVGYHLHTTRASAEGNFVTINVGSRGRAGRIWFRTKSKKFQLVGDLFPDASGLVWEHTHFRPSDWIGIVQTVDAFRAKYRKDLPRAQKSAGLARQSVIQIADQLGIDLTRVAGGGISPAGIAKARAAIASNGRAYVNGFGREDDKTHRYAMSLFTRIPYGGQIGMDMTLLGVLAGRARYIEKAYEKGAFESMAGVCRSFPNLLTLRT